MSLTTRTLTTPAPRLARGAGRLLLATALSLSVAAPLLPARAQQSVSVPTTAKAAPAGTAIFAEFETDLGSAQWTQAGALLSRLGWPTALDDLKAMATEAKPSEGMAGTAPTKEQTEALLGGEVAVAVQPEPIAALVEKALDAPLDANGAPDMSGSGSLYDASGIAMIIAPSDMDLAWGYVEQQFANLATRNGTQVVEGQQDGADVLSVAPGAAATPGPESMDSSYFDGATPEADSGMTGDASAMGMGTNWYGDDSGAAAAKVGDLIVAAATTDDLKPYLDAATGAGPSLADSKEMADVLGNLPTSDGLLFIYSDSAKVVDGLSAQTKEDFKRLAPMLKNVDEAAWRSHGGVIAWADPSGFRFDSIHIGADGADLTALAPQNGPIAGEQKVGADSVVFFGGSVLPGAYDSLAVSMAQGISQGMSGLGAAFGTPVASPVPLPATIREAMSDSSVQQQLDQAKQVLGFDPRDDFFGQFGGQYALALGLPAFGAGGLDFTSVFASDLNDAGRVATSTERIARLLREQTGQDGQASVTARQIGSDRVYAVGDTSGMGVPPVEFGVVGKQFLVGLGKGIDNFVNGPTTSLASSEQYQRVMGMLPAERYQVGYVDLKQIVDLVESFSAMSGTTITDADPACAAFADQAAAQAAYDADPMTNTMLDQNFDGVACEDFFSAATPEASPVPTGSLANLEAFGAAAFQRDGMIGSSAIIAISGS